jgi:hypothetical protein
MMKKVVSLWIAYVSPIWDFGGSLEGFRLREFELVLGSKETKNIA